MKKITLLAFLCLFTAVVSFAQQKRTCEAMEELEHQMQLDPTLRQRMNDIEAFTQRRVAQMEANQGRVVGEIITIPVVVHVLYTNSTNNISDAQILSQIDVLNKDFRRTNTDRTDKWSQAADTQIEFAMATIDPDGNATTAITRKSTTSLDWGTKYKSRNAMKSSASGGIDPWDTTEYLNMWIVPKMTSSDNRSILGFAQFPGGAVETDGLVMIHDAFGSTGTLNPSFNLGRTTTHEIGHFLNLRHIWGDSNCGNDFVSDTPTAQTSNYGCATGNISCGSEDMVQNYMDYSDDACMNLFTLGQKNRMRAVLEAGGDRRSLALSDKFGSGTTPTPTACDTTVDSFPYSQGFESNDGWKQITGDDGNWVRTNASTPSSNTGPTSANEGSYFMFLEASSNSSTGQIGSNATATLESPCFDLSGKSSATFSFKNHMYGSNVGSLTVQASTDNTTWTNIWTASGNKGNQWNTENVNLSAYLNETVKLRLVGTTGNGWSSDIAVDDLSLTTGGSSSTDTQAPTAPSSLTASNITQTTLTLSWSASSDNVGVTGYDIYQGTTNIGTVTGTSANISDLAAGTTHTFSIRAKDAAGNISSASNTVTVTTLTNTVSYCDSSGSRVTYEWIDYVAFGGMTNSTAANGGYGDFTTTKTANVTAGGTHQLVVSAGFSGTAYNEHFTVWIDFNRDGDFADAGEEVTTGNSSSAGNRTADITIPANAALGVTRMRVSMKYNAKSTPCEADLGDGEVEDYAVNITAGSRTTKSFNSYVSGETIRTRNINDILVYPNPTINNIQVKLASKAEGISYRIINVIGSVVKAGRLNSSLINVSDLNSGVYVIEANDGQKTLQTKFIKK